MDFKDLYQIEDEIERIQKTYEIFNEDTRLNRSKAARVEFLTNVRYIEKYLTESSKILDIGAGAGEYSIYFARKGYEVSAIELSENNINSFKRKVLSDDKIDLVQGNALDLSRYQDHSFDVVLLFGPLYHLKKNEDKQRCISEAKRVCKPNGKLFFTFITNDMIILTEFDYKVDACREVLVEGKIKILHEVASDGISELLGDKINQMDDENYHQYLKYHYYICEKKEFLGMTNHLLFVGEK